MMRIALKKITKQKRRTVFAILQLLFFFALGMANAQEITVTGKITSNDGVPLPGVNVIVKGTQNGVNTDFDGNYAITTTQNQTLVFSYVGFKTQERVVSTRVLNITLLEDVASLTEVVVIGYGTKKREDLVGAVSTVKSENIANKQVNTFEEALVGQVSGVQFRQNGAPDGGPEVVIRGLATLGNNTPLYVVDGFPLGNNIGAQRDNFILSSINPQDIESVSVLKDASAKAIYGSRAANGVVIITTKKGGNQKPVISFFNSVGVQTIPEFEKPNVLTAQELYQYQLDFYDDIDAAGLPLGGLQINNRNFLLGLDDIGPNNNWFDLITRQAFVKDYNVSVRGGSERSRYSISAAYQNREGTLINTDFKRYSINANYDIDINDKLRFGMNFAPTRSLATGGRTEGGADNFQIFNAVSLAYWTDPTAPVFDDDGRLTGVTQGNLLFRSRNINPVTLLTERIDERLSNQLRMGAYVELDILKNVTAKTFGSLQYIDRRNNDFTPSRFPGNALNPSFLGTQQASASVFEQNNLNWIWENTLNYNVTIGENHRIDGLLGFTMEKRRATASSITSTNLVDEAIKLPSVENSVEPTDFIGNTSTDSNALVSMIARANYAFKDRYYLTATIRRDGSSRFGAEQRYGNFPSVAGAWRISSEPFFQSLKSVVSDFKVEGGYGVSGNNGLGNYQAQGAISQGFDYIFGGSNEPGVALTTLPNLVASWEESREKNFGIDLGFFNNRVTLSFDYYDIASVGFLASRPLPSTSGFGSVIDNIGEINNKGFEIEGNFRIVENKTFSWSTNLNFSKNRNKVVDLAQEEGFFFPAGSFLAGVNITEVREGQEIGLFRGLKVTGLFTEEDIANPDVAKYPGAIVGSLKFEDQLTVDTDGDGVPDASDGVLNIQDVTIIGNPNPDFTFGMSQQFAYKNFDLSITLDGSVGADLFFAQNQFLGNQDDGQFNIDRRMIERYRPGDDPTTKVIPGTASTPSRQFFRNPNSLSVQNADYLWVRNITLGYNIKGDIMGNAFTSARVFASVQNPILITGYDFGSPTTNRAGDNALVRNVDYGAYPIARTVTLGFNVTF